MSDNKDENLYDILGIDKDASQDDVRKAYRKKAQENHPDKNPNDKDAGKKFYQVKVAYEVLSDAKRRKKYDNYGDTNEDIPQLRVLAIQEVCAMVLQIVDQVDINKTDVIKLAVANFKKNIEIHEDKIEKSKANIAKRRVALSRIKQKRKGKKSGDFIRNAIEKDILDYESGIESAKETITLAKAAIDVANEYEYEVFSFGADDEFDIDDDLEERQKPKRLSKKNLELGMPK